MNTSRIGDLTVDEFWESLEDKLRMLIREELQRVLHEIETKTTDTPNQSGLLSLPALNVGPWPEGLKLLSREEMYGDDDR